MKRACGCMRLQRCAVCAAENAGEVAATFFFLLFVKILKRVFLAREEKRLELATRQMILTEIVFNPE